MTAYVYTPERLKHEIDRLVEERGITHFVLSSGKHGTAHAPSTKVPMYRIPISMPEIFDTTNLSRAMQGFYMLGITDKNHLSEEAQDAIRGVEPQCEPKRGCEE
jgi:hypothetical protein